MSERIIHARFDETGLASALQSLERDYGLNMFVDWAALKGVGVGPGAPVNLDLRDVQVRTVLRAVLKCASGSTRNGALTFWVEDEVVEVSTRARADDMAYVVVYDCSDLIGGELPPRVADILSRLLMELDSSGDLRISSSDDTDYESRDD